MRIGLYPGTFDPVTNGHTDIIKRATKLVDRVVSGVAKNDDKGPLFSTDERVAMLREAVSGFGGDIVVQPFSTLLMHFAEELNAKLGPRFEPPALLRRMVAEGNLGRKSGRGFYEWSTS